VIWIPAFAGMSGPPGTKFCSYVRAPAGEVAACGAFAASGLISDFADGVSPLLALGAAGVADVAGALILAPLPQTGSLSPSPQLRGR
jgi:hypothetical protein